MTERYEQQPPVYSGDLDEDLMLLVGDAVLPVLESIGLTAEADVWGSVLVGTADGEFVQAWGATTTVPRDTTRWYDLLP